MKKWETNEEGKLENFKALPLWVKLYDILLEYWTNAGFSHIARFLGVESTLQTSRISFARICIVMEMDGDFPEKFIVETEFGKEFEVRVEYNGIRRNATSAKNWIMENKIMIWVR